MGGGARAPRADAVGRLVREWCRTWWARIPHPREISIAYTAIYFVALATGIATLAVPPRTVELEIGAYASAALGVLLVLGAVIGMIAGALEHWRLERVGLMFMLTAGIIYAATVSSIHYSEAPGSRLTQIGFIVIACGALVVRYLMIRRFTYRPRG